jgi:membrane associated rhomboid family serine protease
MSNLLHANFQHIFGNTIIMVIFCAIVEAAFPFKIYLLTLVVGGIQGINRDI